MAVVLAVLIITILYSLISGGIGIGEQGVGNITDRANDDSLGENLDFTSHEDNISKPYIQVAGETTADTQI